MSEETPQNDVVINEDVNTGIEVNDSIPASETGEQVQAESNEQVDEEAKKQEAIQKVINEKTFKAKQAEREKAELQAKLDAFEAEKREQMAQQVGNIPPMPDAFDDDYEDKVKRREEALIAQANYNAQNQTYLQQQQLQQQQEAQAKQAKVQESIVSYSNKATELGIKQDELQAAANTVANYGLSDDLVLHILGDSDGPLITKHLAANPTEGFELANMNPYQVGSFLDGIKQKASALKPKTSSTPAPATNLQGNGVDAEAGKYKNIGGAKFE